MTYEEFLQLTEKNLKQYFPESFQERKVEIREVLKITTSNYREYICQVAQATPPSRFYIWNPIIRSLRTERSLKMCGRTSLGIIRSVRKRQ